MATSTKYKEQLWKDCLDAWDAYCKTYWAHVEAESVRDEAERAYDRAQATYDKVVKDML